MEIIAKLGSLLGLSFISGINLYATVAVTGICTKYRLIEGLPPELGVLGNDAVIAVALFLYLVEFFADKIPGFDMLWDSIHTVIRPLGGAFLALLQVGEATPALEVIAFMVGASLASAAHVTKAGARIIINTSPEPFSNILVSFAEDIGVIWFSYFSLAYPRTAFFVTVALVAGILLVMPLIFRTIRMIFSALLFRMKRVLSRAGPGEDVNVPPFHVDAWFESQRKADEKIRWYAKVFAGRIPDVPRFAPVHMVVTTKAVHFFYRRRMKTRSAIVPLEEIHTWKRYPGIVLTRWLLRTSTGDWLFHVYQPLSGTFPKDALPGADA